MLLLVGWTVRLVRSKWFLLRFVGHLPDILLLVVSVVGSATITEDAELQHARGIIFRPLFPVKLGFSFHRIIILRKVVTLLGHFVSLGLQGGSFNVVVALLGALRRDRLQLLLLLDRLRRATLCVCHVEPLCLPVPHLSFCSISR